MTSTNFDRLSDCEVGPLRISPNPGEVLSHPVTKTPVGLST